MRFQDAMLKLRDLSIKMQEHADTAERAGRTYAAVMELYNVASDANDEKGMEGHRNALHTCLDSILDSGAMLSQLRREQREVANKVTDWPAN